MTAKNVGQVTLVTTGHVTELCHPSGHYWDYFPDTRSRLSHFNSFEE